MEKFILLIVVLTLTHSLQAASKWQLIKQEDDGTYASYSSD